MGFFWGKILIISIHAPREGGDFNKPFLVVKRKISIHAPREGGDNRGYNLAEVSKQFQSTPPARGATPPNNSPEQAEKLFQSTPPARGATLHHVKIRYTN